MPMLEALTQLGRGAEGPHLLAILHRLAPAWLAQLPALLTAEESPHQPRVLFRRDEAVVHSKSAGRSESAISCRPAQGEAEVMAESSPLPVCRGRRRR
jgi:hypothetical protein